MADTDLVEQAPVTGAALRNGSHQRPVGTTAAVSAGHTGPKPAPRPPSRNLQKTIIRGLGFGLVLLAVVVFGMAAYLYGLSGLQEARSQRLMYTQMQNELANEGAPLGPTTPGAPVAILDIPSIGIHGMVVVEGTTAEDLTLGPGLRPDAPLPGQAGVSEIYGRRATFGAPFGHLADLRPGDLITAYTGQGKTTYRVAAITDSKYVIKDAAPDRLLLLTASSAVVPTYYIQVDARMAGTVKSGAAVAPAIYSTELPLAGDASALGLAMLWGLALAVVSGGGMLAAAYWSPWAAWLAAVPLLLVALWNLYNSLAVVLPNVY